jgi:hypothetical protein
MQGPNRERWKELCRQAAEEKDPKRLLELANEINRLLAEKENRLLTQRHRRSKRDRPSRLVSVIPTDGFDWQKLAAIGCQ